MAKEQQMGAVRIMAKDLVRTRAHVTKFIEMRSHLQSCGLKLQTVKSHQAMGEAMKNTTKAMEQDGDAEDEDKIVSQVLDEIGISFGEEIPDAPMVGAGTTMVSASTGGKNPVMEDPALNDLEARLNDLNK